MIPAVEWLGFAGGLLGLSISFPQIIRVISTGSYVGVSTSTWLIFTTMASGWFAYGFNVDSISQIITNFVSASATGVLSVLLLRQWMKAPYGALLVSSLWVGAFLLVRLSSPLVGAIFLAVGLGSRIPQLVESFVSMVRARDTVVSRTAFALMMMSSTIWIFYGALANQVTVFWFSIITVTMSGLIILFETVARRRALAQSGTNLET
jgi:uncharacterized protein with PQ loop repeat